MEEAKSNLEGVKRITLAASNISIAKLNELGEYYAKEPTTALRIIMSEFVEDPEIIEDFYKYYHDRYSKEKMVGVISNSFKKTYYIHPGVLDKFSKIIKKAGEEARKQRILSDMIRALIYYFYKIKIQDHKGKSDRFIKGLEEKGNFKILSYKLAEPGLIVTIDLNEKETKADE